MWKKCLSIVCCALLATCVLYHQSIHRFFEGYRILRTSKERVQLYRLPEGASILDVTQSLVGDPSIPDGLKEPLRNGSRKILIFKYLSDGMPVAGFLSYLTDGEHPLMVFLRGGNGYFGVMRPNSRFSFLEGYNVVGTLYRGNLYGGVDEMGGQDVVDVENLLKFLPELEEASCTSLRPPFVMMGVSRGAMEMFTALSRLEYVKERVTHAISVSGAVDLPYNISKRFDMRHLLKKKFKLSGEGDFEVWLKKRDPVTNAPSLDPSLKTLIIWGDKDNRVFREEQLHLQKALEEVGIASELLIIPGANHGLDPHFSAFQESVLRFLNQGRATSPSRS